MKQIFSYVLACTLLLPIGNAAKADNPLKGSAKKAYQIPATLPSSEYFPNVVVIKIAANVEGAMQRNSIAVPELQDVLNALNVKHLAQQFPNANRVASRMPDGSMAPDLRRIYRIEYSAAIPLQDVINKLASFASVEYAEPAFIYRMSYIPNDPDTAGNKNYYQEIVKAYQAWDVTKGDTNVTIGIVDSGGDLDHPDLAANVKYNYADPIDGIDNDNDGYIDNFKGWDLVGNTVPFTPDGNPQIGLAGNDHGVHVGGDAGAVADNNTGVAGLGFKCKLLFIKTTTDDFSTGIFAGYEGIVYAADMGADIINCSWGGAGGGSAGQDVINYALSKGSLVIAAAGNSSVEDVFFPAGFDNVMAIASTTSLDRRSSFSNYGYWIDASAPGSSIYSTTYNDSYGSYDGTSMASPIAAGAAALVKSQFPNYTPLQIQEQLRVTADDITSKNSATFADKLGKGRINAFRAVTVQSPAVRIKDYQIFDNSNGSYLPGDTLTINLDLINYLQATTNLQVTMSSSNANVQIFNATQSVGALATSATTSANGFKVFIKPSAPENGAVGLKLSFSDGTYVDFQYISIVVNLSSINVTVNQIASTATGNGRVGFRNGDATGGLGISYKGFNMLYEGSMMIGASASQVSNNSRSETAVADEHFTTLQRITPQSTPGVDFLAGGEFDDSGSPSPIGVSSKHRTLAWASAPDDKYFIVEHRVNNNTASALSGLYTGMFFDIDISDYTANQVVYDSVLRMAVASTYVSTEPLLAVKILSTVAPAAYYGQANGELPQDGGFTLAEKYQTLSSGIVNKEKGTNSTGLDIMFTIGTGPYNIPAADSKRFAYAIIAGDNLADVQASAAAAQAKYDNFVSVLGIGDDRKAKNVYLYPNPSSDYVDVILPVNSIKVKVNIFDLAGKLVLSTEKLVDEDSFRLDVSKLQSGNYMLQVKDGVNEYNQKLQVK